MIKPEMIPDEVVKEAMLSWAGSEGAVWAAMREAIAAALNAWPDMFHHPAREGETECVFLFLPTENSDE